MKEQRGQQGTLQVLEVLGQHKQPVRHEKPAVEPHVDLGLDLRVIAEQRQQLDQVEELKTESRKSWGGGSASSARRALRGGSP